jgi:hypothetical protein
VRHATAIGTTLPPVANQTARRRFFRLSWIVGI